MNLPNILIGCPVQNRQHTILQNLMGIYCLDYPKDKIHLAFYVNNSDDKTLELLEMFDEIHWRHYRKITIWEEYGIANEYQDGQELDRDYNAFSEIRNRWLEMLTPDDEFLFSVDSDIILQPNHLKDLLRHDKDICSLLIHNGFGFYNILNWDQRGWYKHIYKPERIFQSVDVTGACILIKRNVIDSGVRYGYHKQGEDFYFCEQAKNIGFEIFSDCSLEAKHLGGSNELLKTYRNRNSKR